jgi:hypothetical protein
LADEDSKFAQWFENQKTYEKRKGKKTQNPGFAKDISIITSSSAAKTATQSDANSTYGGVADITLEEKK